MDVVGVQLKNGVGNAALLGKASEDRLRCSAYLRVGVSVEQIPSLVVKGLYPRENDVGHQSSVKRMIVVEHKVIELSHEAIHESQVLLGGKAVGGQHEGGVD